MVLFLLVGAAAFAGERAYTHHKKSKAKKLARSQPQQSHSTMDTVPVTSARSAEVDDEDEDSYEDLPAYQKDQGQVQPPMYSPSVSQDTIPIPERSPLREKAAM